MQPARWLVVEKVFQPAKVATRLKTRGRKDFPTSLSWNQHEHSSSNRFSNQPSLQPARELVIEMVFQQATVATGSKICRGKGFPTS